MPERQHEPTAAPETDRITLSAINCTTMRPRDAPSAMRTAISCRRPAPRTRSRLATLAQAMSTTQSPEPMISTINAFCCG